MFSRSTLAAGLNRTRRRHLFMVGAMAAIGVTAVPVLVSADVPAWLLPLYSLMTLGWFAVRLMIAAGYREPTDQGHEPLVSVIIPVKNEELGISLTIRQCLESHYPLEKLEVIAVDDGSTDRTWDKLLAMQTEYGSLSLHRFPKNLGKRFAMAWGIQHARGEILIFVDSDTRVHPDAIRRIVQPFTCAEVGAVSGHVRVAPTSSLISGIEAVRYFVSHRVFKAAESVLGCVTCCPGAGFDHKSAHPRQAASGVR